MDLFSYKPTYRVWICVSCQYALCPQRLEGYLRRQHAKHPTAATAAMLQRPWLDPAQEPCVFPASSSSPVPGLPIHEIESVFSKSIRSFVLWYKQGQLLSQCTLFLPVEK
ncbi:hypothetical protein BDV33DRAFT_210981 [Aspergillus novoparasiticus]|uniref:Uncharacterized protein n=1 Tax=Aspergillus novoparasiticus TaxID=986946 RepID=A0A5N6E7E8_9EURO|nr:hypothetical protein BDV33DRAFT_210981 [Aspergillus novoparasiticus]